MRAEYERALTLAKQQIGPLPTAPGGRTAAADRRRLAAGPRHQGPVGRRLLAARRGTRRQPVCQHLRALSRLPRRPQPPGRPAAQRVDARALAADAGARGWSTGADRHRRLAERLDALIAQAQAG